MSGVIATSALFEDNTMHCNYGVRSRHELPTGKEGGWMKIVFVDDQWRVYVVR